MGAKNESAEISKIVLNISGKEISLTPRQAEQLFDALEVMFGKNTVEHHHHDYVPRRPYWPWPGLFCQSENTDHAKTVVDWKYTPDSHAATLYVK